MEFKVRTKKLKGSANNIRNSWAGLRGARWEIESVMRNLDLGKSTGDIRDSLKKSRDKVSFFETVSTKARSNLDAIATQYEITEKAIKNQKGKKVSIADIIKTAGTGGAIPASTWKKWFNKGKKWFKKYAGDPVAVDSGNFILDEIDLGINTNDPFLFTRFYNSQERETGSLGLGWVHNYDFRINVTQEGATVTLGDGSDEAFTKIKDGYLAVAGTSTLKTEGDTYRYTTINDESYIFDSRGDFIRCENANGYGYSLEYEAGKLVKVVRDNGDWFALSYSEADPDRLASLTDQSGRTVSYEYEGRCLTAVISGDRVLRYGYDKEGRLSDVIDGRGITFVHNKYDEEDRVIRQFFADDSEIRYTYDEDNAATVVTEKDESESYHFHDALFRNTENVYTNGSESFEYDGNNQITSETDRNGNETRYWYDDKGRVSRVKRADGTEVNLTYEKHNKPVSISVNGVRKEKNVYDSRGNLIETTDALGRRTSYKYNEQGFVTETRSPSGKVIRISYDEKNNPVKVIGEDGSATLYEYDDLNRRTGVRDGRGNATKLEYDRFGHITGITNASGHKRSYRFNKIDQIEEFVDFNGARTTIEYNAVGFPVRMTDPLGRITEDEYDSMWHLAARKLPNGGVVRAEYDAEGRPAKITDPLGNETLYTYDGNGNLILTVEPEGAITEYKYDSFDNLISITDPEGNETVYSYDACKNLVYIRNANGGEAHLEYDAADQLIRETDALGQSREYAYTPDGDVCKVIDEAGRVTLLEYAFTGKPSRIVYPDGKEECYTYDENGNLKSRYDNQGNRTEFTYDELDRVIEIEGSEGEHNFYTYDAMGNIISASDAQGNTITYEYTLTGQLSSVTDELGNRTEYSYDALDLLTEFRRIGSNGEIHKTQYRRDIAGNVVEAIDPLGYVEKFVYNGRGEIAQKTDKDGYLTKYGYNKNNELTSLVYDDGKEVHMTHDSLGKLSEIIDWTGTTKVESDILGRVTKVIYPDERTAEYTYGKTGERTSIKYPDGRTVKYGYDKALRLKSLEEGDTSVKYGYDECGRLVSKVFASGLAAKYAYDARGHVTEITNMRGSEVIESVKAAYDGNGNKISALWNRAGLPEDSGLFEYSYDPAGRLSSVSKDGVRLKDYEYDAFGNRSALISNGARTDYHYDAMDRLLETSGAVNEVFRYDNRGNVVERSLNGSVINTYEYDPSGSMKSARSGNAVASYEYNGLGHRIEDRIIDGSEPERRIKYTVDMTKYFNNLLERDINGASEAYLFDGIPIALKGSSDYEFVSDDMGSPVRLLGMDGSNAELYGYDEFGTSLHAGSDLQPIRYMGYREDPVAGMYFVQAREYMPEHGRFAAQDKIKGNTVNPFTLNGYVYCMSSPFYYYDPDGMLWHVLVGAAVGGLVSGGFELGKQIIKAKVKGEPVKINWAKVGTSALGGAINGGMISAGCPTWAAAGVSGAFEGFFEAYNVDGKSFKESVITGVKTGVISGALAGAGELFKKTSMGEKLANATTNKWAKQYKADMEFMNDVMRNTGYKMHPGWSTVLNGLAGGTLQNLQKYIKPSTWVKKIATGKWNPICYGRDIVDDPRKVVDAL